MADLEVNINDGIATLIMNRPEVRNALSMEMRGLLDEALHQLEFDENIRCIVLNGAGEHFMAGGDVRQMHEYLGAHEGQEIDLEFRD